MYCVFEGRKLISRDVYDAVVERRICKAELKTKQFLLDMAKQNILLADKMIEWYHKNMPKPCSLKAEESYLMAIHEIKQQTAYYHAIIKSM